MKAPELLAPAGTLRNLRYAMAFGADAVYAGMPRYSLRVRNNDFHRIENLAAGIAEVHARGKAFFMATNVLPHNSKVKTFLEDMQPIVELGGPGSDYDGSRTRAGPADTPVSTGKHHELRQCEVLATARHQADYPVARTVLGTGRGNSPGLP